MDILFNKFPREFGVKRTLARDYNNFVALINKFNGVKDCYSSIYPVTHEHKRYITSVDKIFFDLDKHSTCWESTKQMHNWLSLKEYKHIILLSGGGFHVYVFTTTGTLKYAKHAVNNAQHYIADKCRVTIGKPNKADVDEHVIGDIARIARIPNTYNIKRKRFCVYINSSDFNKSFDEIKLLAKKQRYDREIFGTKLFEIEQHDEEPHINIHDVIKVETPDELKNVENILKLVPPLIRHLLINQKDGYYDRFLTVLGLRESGIPENLGKEICKKYWSAEKYNHALYDENDNIRYLYNKLDQFFPNWDTIAKKGYVLTKEDLEFKFYK